VLAIDICNSDGNKRRMGIWQDLFELRKYLGYYQILKGSVSDFTEKLTHNLSGSFFGGQVKHILNIL